MPEASDKPGPSRKTIIGWTAVLLTVIGLSLLVGLVIVPAYRIHRILGRCGRSLEIDLAIRRQIPKLGGKHEAVRLCSLYLNMPEGIATHQMMAVAMLAHCGEEAVPVLIPQLSHNDASRRRCVAGTLGRIGDARALAPLAEALKDADRDVRMAAARALGDIGTPAAVPPLIGALKDAVPHVRITSAQAFLRTSDEKAVQALEALLQEDMNRKVQRYARQVLTRLASQARDKTVSRAATEALARVRARTRVPLKFIETPVRVEKSHLVGLNEAELAKRGVLAELEPVPGETNKRQCPTDLCFRFKGKRTWRRRFHVLTFENGKVVRHEMVDRREPD